MYFGKTIKLFRTSKSLTQVEVAKSLGISSEYLSKLENDAKRPSLVLLTKMSQVLEIPLQLLIFSSLEENDLPVTSRKSFKESKPVLTELINKLLSEDTDDFEQITVLLEQLKEIRGARYSKTKIA